MYFCKDEKVAKSTEITIKILLGPIRATIITSMTSS